MPVADAAAGGRGQPPDAARLDVAGAVTVTLALLLAVYAIVDGNEAGWTSAQTLGLLAAAVVLVVAFVVIESRVASPLVPLRLFRLRNLVTANIVGVLWSTAMFAWFFLSALYMQLVLGYTPLRGRARLPARPTSSWAAFSLGLSAKVVMRFGIRWPLALGLALVAARPGAVRARAGRRRLRRRRAARAWCCSASASASPSTRCCSRR